MRNTLRLTVLALAVAALSSGRMTAQSTSAKAPADKGIQTPEQYFGFKIGADGELARYPKILEYFQFLAQQTDRLFAAAKTGKAVNVKKGQFMAPWDMQHVVQKLGSAGCKNVLLCERGTFFGYGRLVNDMRALIQMRELGVPVVFDATHSVQEPGGLGSATGGNRAMVEPLARAATAIGIDGLFFETHPDPDHAPSDGPNMLRLDDFPGVLKRILQIRQTVESLA